MVICKFIICVSQDKLKSPAKQGFFDQMRRYPEKILLAWGEAFGGNSEIRDWLLKEGYPELGLFCFALYFDKKASNWLFKNTPHLLALIKATEGKKDAIIWLKLKFPVLHKVALAADGEILEMEYLLKNDRLMAGIAQKIKFIKDQIEEANNDVHRWGFE